MIIHCAGFNLELKYIDKVETDTKLNEVVIKLREVITVQLKGSVGWSYAATDMKIEK